MNSTPQTESRHNSREIPGLPGEYVAGLVDGEGCLALGYRRTRNVLGGRERLYYSWQPQLAIVMHKRDKPLLEAVRHTIECGTVYEHRSTVSLRVYAIADLAEKVVPFLRSFPLRSEKRVEFKLWARAIDLVWQYCARPGRNAAPGRKGFRPQNWPEAVTAELTDLALQLAALKGHGRRPKFIR